MLRAEGGLTKEQISTLKQQVEAQIEKNKRERESRTKEIKIPSYISITDVSNINRKLIEKEKQTGDIKTEKLEVEIASFESLDRTIPYLHNSTNVDFNKITDKFDEITVELGNILMDITKDISEFDYSIEKMFSQFENYFFGVSIDKRYHGIHVLKPFKGIFINPMYLKGKTIKGKATRLLDTIIHELAHFKAHNHGEEFSQEMARLINLLSDSDLYDKFYKKVINFVEKYEAELNDLNYEFEKSTTRNVNKGIGEKFISQRTDGYNQSQDNALQRIGIRPAGYRRVEKTVQGSSGYPGRVLSYPIRDLDERDTEDIVRNQEVRVIYEKLEEDVSEQVKNKLERVRNHWDEYVEQLAETAKAIYDSSVEDEFITERDIILGSSQ